MKKILTIATLIVALTVMSSCGSSRNVTLTLPNGLLNLAITENPIADKYANMDYGIRLNVVDARAKMALVHVYDASTISVPQFTANPSVNSFVSESMRRYMRTMGFNLDADPSTDYWMEVSLTEFHVDYLSGIGWSATVMMSVKVLDHNRTLVYPTVEVAGRYNMTGSAYSKDIANRVLNQAYTEALKDIDWDRIAFFLHRASSPKQEPNKQVTGEGNTALEHLTIHWDVNSRPQGADIFWRVISSTPEVKNQNYKYLQTTPYETTEVFDIKGLTYNNAGNVQIEIKCEKTGYYTQSKKFNVSSIIEEKEISAFFRLVAEEE
ncbi:MAG: hypothetical protein J6J29_03735 [Paludibacteraceae bacterium]|nr:hypothetical protein [Paludibacteraceae bacterium]